MTSHAFTSNGRSESSYLLLLFDPDLRRQLPCSWGFLPGTGSKPAQHRDVFDLLLFRGPLLRVLCVAAMVCSSYFQV